MTPQIRWFYPITNDDIPIFRRTPPIGGFKRPNSALQRYYKRERETEREREREREKVSVMIQGSKSALIEVFMEEFKEIKILALSEDDEDNDPKQVNNKNCKRSQ